MGHTRGYRGVDIISVGTCGECKAVTINSTISADDGTEYFMTAFRKRDFFKFSYLSRGSVAKQPVFFFFF